MGIFRHPPSPHIGNYQPLEQRKLPVSVTAVVVDDPPFGINAAMWRVVSAWQSVGLQRESTKGFIQSVEGALRMMRTNKWHRNR